MNDYSIIIAVILFQEHCNYYDNYKGLERENKKGIHSGIVDELGDTTFPANTPGELFKTDEYTFESTKQIADILRNIL